MQASLSMVFLGFFAKGFLDVSNHQTKKHWDSKDRYLLVFSVFFLPQKKKVKSAGFQSLFPWNCLLSRGNH